MNHPGSPQSVKFTLLMGLFMALSMSFVMSFAMTAVNSGFSPGFLLRWGRGFCIGISVAYPTALLAGPFCRSLTQKILTRNSAGKF